MLHLLIYIFSITALMLIIALFLKFWNAPIRKVYESISKMDLGLLEGSISSLEEIIIISDVIEEPTESLYKSVVSNLKRNVKYKFIVSKSKYDTERNKYFQIFKAIAKSNNLTNSVMISSLEIEWNNFPCIFYKLTNGYVFAFMGNEQKEGIAEGYDFVGPQLAKSLLRLSNYATQIDEIKILSYEQTFDKISLKQELSLN
jgi:hypothetical protein